MRSIPRTDALRIPLNKMVRLGGRRLDLDRLSERARQVVVDLQALRGVSSVAHATGVAHALQS